VDDAALEQAIRDLLASINLNIPVNPPALGITKQKAVTCFGPTAPQ
jgi:hypothetical protein